MATRPRRPRASPPTQTAPRQAPRHAAPFTPATPAPPHASANAQPPAPPTPSEPARQKKTYQKRQVGTRDTRVRAYAEAGKRATQATAIAKVRFLRAYAKHGNTLHSCIAGNVGRTTVENWCDPSSGQYDPAFAAAKAQAATDANDAMEAEVYRRSQVGVLRPVYQGGELVGHTREYSDRLLELRTKARLPKIYRESRLEVTGLDGGPVEIAWDLKGIPMPGSEPEK